MPDNDQAPNAEDWIPSDIGKSWTSNNYVTPFIDGKAYMEDLYNKIIATAGGDFIYATGWFFSLDQCLKGQNDIYSNFIKLLIDKAINHDVEVKILPWFPEGVQRLGGKDNRNHHLYLYFKSIELNNDNFQVSLAKNYISNGSHHQKAIVIGQRAGDNILTIKCAYVGGIDIASDRWDTNAHNNDANRNMKDFYGWHDIHTRVEGPACIEIFNNFMERWDALKDDDGFYIDVTKTCDDGKFSAKLSEDISPISINWKTFWENYPIEEHITLPGGVINNICNVAISALPPVIFTYKSPKYSQINGTALEPTGSHENTYSNLKIKVLRTIGKGSLPKNATEPEPEHSILEAFTHAIGQAKYYIYIEDQYFWYSKTLINHLMEAAGKGVKIIVLTVKKSDQTNPITLAAHNYAWNKNFYFINNENNESTTKDAVSIYHLDPLKRTPPINNRCSENRCKQIYVHAKLMIIDDRFVTIGSANMNDRSMTCDTEIAIAIYDNNLLYNKAMKSSTTFQKNKFAFELRKKIWKHHLGSDIDNPLDKIDNKIQSNGLIQKHIIDELFSPCFLPEFSPIPISVVNNDTVCPSYGKEIVLKNILNPKKDIL